MGLKNIISLETAKRRFNYSLPYLDMAVIPEVDEEGNPSIAVVKEKGENIDDIPDKSLEDQVKSELGSEELAKDAVEGKYAAQRAEELDEEFYKSGKYENFANWCVANSLNMPERAKGYGASSSKDRGAFAYPEIGVIGINTYTDKTLQRIAKECKFTADPINQAKEHLLTHEYGHLAQNLPSTENLSKSERYSIEADNELSQAKYFYFRSANTSDETEKKYYAELTNTCLSRYAAMYSGYLKEQGIDIELNEETAKQLVEDSDFQEYIKSVQPKNLKDKAKESDLEDKVIEGKFEKSDTKENQDPEEPDYEAVPEAA